MSLIPAPYRWLAILALLAAIFGYGWIKGAQHGERELDRFKAELNAAKALANEEARRIEHQRQRRADESAQLAAAREARLRSDSADALRESNGLRDDLSAIRLHASQSITASNETVRVITGILEECSRTLVEMAGHAERAHLEALELRMAWPR